ncbi:MAG: hypothetical protein JWN67_4998 [Actinomycetia bacterium]|nr:hypothetical protein [Actinomycetes bacterium]
MSVRKRITVTLDLGLVGQLDEAASEVGVSRNAYIERLIQDGDWSRVTEDFEAERG